ncbi:OmpA family protein [Methylobacterium komagatae]
MLPAPKVDVPTQITVSLGSKPSQLDRIRAALAEEIAAGSVAVEPFGSWIAVRISNGVVFASGEPHVIPASLAILRKIADVVQAEKGPVRIVGYTDDQPIRSARIFRDNQALSLARAEAVAALIRPALSETGRITVGGRGADEPITENATPEGRARNRRVEVLITRQP